MNKSLFIFLIFSLLASGCSTANIVYRNADWYLAHEIKGYTSFNDGQKETIRKEVSNYMLWHRKKALPEYIIFLQNLNGAAQFEGELSTDKAALLRAHLMNLYKMTMAPAIRPAAQLLSGLDGAQIQELAESSAERLQEQREDALEGSHDEILERRAKKTISFLEWLAGDLSSEQKVKVRAMSRQLPLVSDIYFQYRDANQRKLITLLNNHVGTEKIAAFLSSWVLTPESTRTQQQQHDIESFESATDEMVSHIHGMLTAAQKSHLNKRLASYIEDMRTLIPDKHAASNTLPREQ